MIFICRWKGQRKFIGRSIRLFRMVTLPFRMVRFARVTTFRMFPFRVVTFPFRMITIFPFGMVTIMFVITFHVRSVTVGLFLVIFVVTILAIAGAK